MARALESEGGTASAPSPSVDWAPVQAPELRLRGAVSELNRQLAYRGWCVVAELEADDLGRTWIVIRRVGIARDPVSRGPSAARFLASDEPGDELVARVLRALEVDAGTRSPYLPPSGLSVGAWCWFD